ncbi:hypothetical protein SNL152K_10835 [Streptomyces sp. NL15-2K]|nr:hypothetical protein SNL152K_10835 [Streptomyces sp. NL15-2K]
MPIVGPAKPVGWQVLDGIEQGTGTSTMEGRAMFGMLCVLARPRRKLIVANTNDGLASARAPGRSWSRLSSLPIRPSSPSSSTTHFLPS